MPTPIVITIDPTTPRITYEMPPRNRIPMMIASTTTVAPRSGCSARSAVTIPITASIGMKPFRKECMYSCRVTVNPDVKMTAASFVTSDT